MYVQGVTCTSNLNVNSTHPSSLMAVRVPSGQTVPALHLVSGSASGPLPNQFYVGNAHDIVLNGGTWGAGCGIYNMASYPIIVANASSVTASLTPAVSKALICKQATKASE